MPGSHLAALVMETVATKPKHELQSPQKAALVGAPPQPGVVVGRMCHGSSPVGPIVDFDGNLQGPLRARTIVALDTASIERAVGTGQGVALVFEKGDPRLPIVAGLVQQDQPLSPLQALLVTPRTASPAEPQTARPRAEARLDGERVVLEGKHEVVLKCGDASITLRRDGKVIVRGAYVETHARGVNRIKGGAVKIN